MDRPEQYTVTTVTGKTITLTKEETTTMYNFIDIGMPQEFINTWMYDIISMHNLDDTMQPTNSRFEYVDANYEDEDNADNLLYWVICAIVVCVAGLAIWETLF